MDRIVQTVVTFDRRQVRSRRPFAHKHRLVIIRSWQRTLGAWTGRTEFAGGYLVHGTVVSL